VCAELVVYIYWSHLT